MKPLFLTIEGLPNKEKQSFDFTMQTASLVAICNQDISELKEYMALGFYGLGEKGKIELAYEYNGEEYIIKRNFDNKSAKISCKEGYLICEGVDEVNNQINAHLKLTKAAFDKLVVIDRDNIYDTFIESAQAREQYVGSLLDELVFDKAEISLIEEKIKEKYDKTLMQIEITEEVSPQELADLKQEIKEKSLIRYDIDTELMALYENINKGEEATKSQKILEQETQLLEKAKAKLPVIDELYKVLKNSNEAEIINTLIERKETLIEKDKILIERRDEISKEIEKDNLTIEKGQKSDKSMEKILIHCLERLKQLRKLLYNNIDAVSNDENYQNSIKEKINSFYKKEDQEIVLLNEKKEEIETQLAALEQSYSDIYARIKDIGINADLKKAVREGAVLETEMKKLTEIISATKLSAEARVNRNSDIKLEITQKEEILARNQLKLADINNFVIGNFESREKSVENADKATEELHKIHIFISSQQQEIDAIDNKIEENRAGMKEYEEDIEVLNGAKEGLQGYISKQKKSIQFIEDKLFSMKVNYDQFKQITELEYGQECPVCNSVVLNKKNKNYKIDDLKRKIDTANQELTNSRDILNQYDEKMQLINSRAGELTARIKISKAYIESLESNKQQKTGYIKDLLQNAGANSSYELTQMLNKAKEKSRSLKRANEDYKLLQKDINNLTQNIELLKQESAKIEQEELPALEERYSSAVERLSVCETEHSQLKIMLGERNALDMLEEFALVEKEHQTLINDLTEKRTKINELLQEKENTNQLIYLLESRSKNIIVSGKEYDYQALNIKVIGDSVGELLTEIRKSEEEAEQIKTELAAIRRVLGDIKIRKAKNMSELEQLNARIESDKDILEQIMSDFNGKLIVMKIDNTKELRKLVLTEERKKDIKEEIASYSNAIVLHEQNRERLQKIVDDNTENIEFLEENKAKIKVLKERYESLGYEIANITAIRAEMKSRAKQLFALKEKLAKYKEKLKVLGEIVNLINENGDITNYIIKLASKRLYALSKGKYNLDTENGELVLLNNSNGGKHVNSKNYSREEKLLISLVIGTSLHRTLIDMVGGEPFMLIFPLKEKEANKDIAAALATYAKKKSLMVVADNKSILNELEKLN